MPTRIEQLASNSTMYYRGDVCLEISPFTNYYMLTIYRESNDSSVDDSVPLNLTNLGRVYMSFMSGGEKIRIPNYTLAENVDMANGEVAFRISSEEAERILNFSNHTFYISTVIGDGNASSDETVLYSGQWSDYATAMQTSLTETINSLNGTISDLNIRITNLTETYESRISDLNTELDAKQSELDSLYARVSELEEQLAQIDTSYIEATIVDESSKYIPNSPSVTSATDAKYVKNVQLDASSLERVDLKSFFKTTTVDSNDLKTKTTSSSVSKAKTIANANVSKVQTIANVNVSKVKKS